jgi:predicted RNA-binding protein with PIN domain
MKTTLIVDGYNAINAIAKTRAELMNGDLQRARKSIISICKEYARSSGYITDVCVVFDGDDKYRHLDKINIPRGKGEVYSRTGQGDDKIIETVKRHAAFSRVIVASNDNYVRNMSRGYGASLIDVKELVADKVKSSKLKDKGQQKKLDKKVEDEITKDYMEELGL